jgi:hypothetical protein
MPITIFCVAIATEDGCFFSGLRHRFELGHLYPQTARDKLSERSPICICTDSGKPQLVTDMSPQERQETATHDDKEHFRRGHEDSWNSDDSSGYMSVDGAGGDATGYKCSCPFSGLQGDSLDDDDEDEDGPFQLYRGTRGPGSWHCYAAVFDCESSLIRVDGVPEQMSCDSTSMETFAASLDGLTIGSDHSFDMSLCFGQGSDGEGEGAISELVMFKGRLDPYDIAVIEQQLMSKHGIQPPALPALELAQEDQMTKQAHALLAHPPHHKMFAASTVQVPLRYAARHRLVAWRQSHAVTGEPVKVQKIGSRLGDSSSDW